MAAATWREKAKYKFDNWMSKGVLALIGLLSVAAFLAIVLVSAIVELLGINPEGESIDFGEALWLSLMRTLDGGTMGADRGVAFRASMLLITLIGLVVVAALIGIVGNAFNSRLEELRKGRSKVLEENHTLILGWNSKIFQVIRELVLANESRSKPRIVIMADRDRIEMEDEIKANIKKLGNTKLILRSGDPMSLLDLRITNFEKARSVLILPPDEVTHRDSVAIKTVLALLSNEADNESDSHIVAVISDPDNLEAARLIGGSRVTWIEADDLICRLIVQTSRQAGLSAVFTDLLDFEGSEMYLREAGSLANVAYSTAVSMVSSGCLMGVVRAGEVLLNPVGELVIAADDKLIIIAEDDSTIRLAASTNFDASRFANSDWASRTSENFLVIANGRASDRIVSELAGYLAPGSTITVVAKGTQNRATVDGIHIGYVELDPTKRKTFDVLDLSRFQHAIVLADDSLGDVQTADARTLHTLLHIRDCIRTKNLQINVVSEMLDDHNRELAEITKADDFIVSDKLVSYMMAQLEENDGLSPVFAMLFSPVGSEISLRSVEEYVTLDADVTFDTVVAAAIAKGDSAIGHRILNEHGNADSGWVVELAPDRQRPRRYATGDKIVVLTEK